MEISEYSVDLKIKEEIADGHDGFKHAYLCQYCCQAFAHKCHLEAHYQRVHHDKSPYNCSQCNSFFKTSSGLRKHCKKQHCPVNKAMNFACQFCGMHFQYETHLDTHYQVSHGETLPYTCRCCNKQFKTLKSLRKHYLCVQRGKVFICSFCEKSFARPDNMKAHMIRKHTDEKPFVCKYCDKAFVEKSQLRSHIRTHTGEKPFTCMLCGRSFAEKGALNMHVRRHTGEKPYNCQLCGKLFARSCSLARHKLVHTQEKNYKCLTCDKLFARSDQLKIHQKSHLRKR